jgi:DNA processing protein
VLGCGLDRVYPPENTRLFLDTVNAGALVTEFPLYTAPNKPNFPRRNRIISGLSLGVLVVEASRKSGSLITASHALDQGRLVLAVPGPVGPHFHVGTNQLIQEGASIVLDAEDILIALNLYIRQKPRGEIASLGPEADAVLEACRFEALTLDAVASRCKLPVNKVMRIVSRLEVQGRLDRVPGARFLEADQRPKAKK